MLIEGHARDAFLLLDYTGLLKAVLPEIFVMKGVEQPPQFHPEGDVFIHTLLMLEKLPAACSPHWRGALFTMWASHRLFESRQIASALTGTWMSGRR